MERVYLIPENMKLNKVYYCQVDQRQISLFGRTHPFLLYKKGFKKAKFSDLCTSKRNFVGYFQPNTYTYFQEICSWTMYINGKFTREK